MSKIIIDPEKEYVPSEIAENEFILSGIEEKSIRHVQRLIQHGKLKAREIIVTDKLKVYKVKGSEIIRYQKELKK